MTNTSARERNVPGGASFHPTLRISYGDDAFFGGLRRRGLRVEVAAKYPVGSEVDVHYDPKNPETSALRTAGGAGATWIIFAAALIIFALAASLLGIFG